MLVSLAWKILKFISLASLSMEEQVHIVPLGFEIDRAVIPFEKRSFLPHRIYLLSIHDSPKYRREMNLQQRRFREEVTRRLRASGVQDVRNIDADIFSLKKMLAKISSIIRSETSAGNVVYVNMSAAGRMASVSATLAGMAHGAKVYYVHADDYTYGDPKEMERHGLSICKEPTIEILENFRFHLPELPAQKLLAELAARPEGMDSWEILEFLKRSGDRRFQDVPKDERKFARLERGIKSRYLMRLRTSLLNKLAEQGHILIEKKGRNMAVRITENGRYVAHLSGQMVV